MTQPWVKAPAFPRSAVSLVWASWATLSGGWGPSLRVPLALPRPTFPACGSALNATPSPRPAPAGAHHHLCHQVRLPGEVEGAGLGIAADGLAGHEHALDQTQLQSRVLEGRWAAGGRRRPPHSTVLPRRGGPRGCTQNGWRSRQHRPDHRPFPPSTATLAPPEGLSACPPPALTEATRIGGPGMEPLRPPALYLARADSVLCIPCEGLSRWEGKGARPRRAPVEGACPCLSYQLGLWGWSGEGVQGCCPGDTKGQKKKRPSEYPTPQPTPGDPRGPVLRGRSPTAPPEV